MTATEAIPPTDSWNEQLAQLKAHSRHVREPILVALNILQHDQSITLEDAKAKAALHGVRITAASVAAAQRLLRRRDADGNEATPTSASKTASAASVPSRTTRRPRAPEPVLDPTAMIQQVVAKLQEQGYAEAERLRDAMRAAIAGLQAAVG